MRVVILLCLMACGGGKKEPSPEELHKQLSPQIEPKLVTIEKIIKEPLPEPTGAIKLDGPPLHIFEYPSGAGNAIYAYDADLRSIERYQKNPLRYNFNGQLVNDCFMMVRKKMLAGGDFETYSRDPMPWKGDEHIVREKLPECAALRYLVIVKLDAFQDTKYIDKEKFGGGGALAQAHVFDLEAGGKYAGGVAFSAKSSDYVKGDIDSDLQNNFFKAMESAIKAKLPDAAL
jgi:hypothetical protein